MPIGKGTNFFNGSTVDVALTDNAGNATLVRCTVANIPSGAAGYAVGCLLQATDTGGIYTNTGSITSSTFTLLEDAGGNFTLPITATDSTTTTGTSAAFTQNAVTTGKGFSQSLTGLTTGIGHQVTAAAATLTTGRYFSANDGALEVLGIGANGHIHTSQTTAPTIAVSTQNGITAAAITAGGTDVTGVITTTGTNDNGGATVLQVTFNKTYTSAPKSVTLTPRNASGAGPNPPYISAITATTFDITIPASASAGATPSWSYLVVA